MTETAIKPDRAPDFLVLCKMDKRPFYRFWVDERVCEFIYKDDEANNLVRPFIWDEKTCRLMCVNVNDNDELCESSWFEWLSTEDTSKTDSPDYFVTEVKDAFMEYMIEKELLGDNNE